MFRNKIIEHNRRVVMEEAVAEELEIGRGFFVGLELLADLYVEVLVVHHRQHAHDQREALYFVDVELLAIAHGAPEQAVVEADVVAAKGVEQPFQLFDFIGDSGGLVLYFLEVGQHQQSQRHP
jgi:hypothetical protein